MFDLFDRPQKGRRDAYKPPRDDLPVNVALARVMLKNRPHMRGLTPNGLRCQFHLKIKTAEQLIEIERLRRGESD